MPTSPLVRGRGADTVPLSHCIWLGIVVPKGTDALFFPRELP